MNKAGRHFAIREIIGSRPITSQAQLKKELHKHGFRVTQATLSRDLKDLGVSRGIAEGVHRYLLPSTAEAQILRPLVGAEVVSMQANECLIVIRTLPGCANTVGEFIDIQDHPGVIGTVAGDNTLLVVPESRKKTKHVMQFLKNKLIEGR
jgi:transcriptional regulator of arginine metabolism